MTKRIFLGLALLGAFSGLAVAQPRNVESAAIALNQDLVADAKQYIDEAASHESTKNDRKMWFYRAKVYLIIATEEKHRSMDPDAGYKALESAINCVRTDIENGKRKYNPDAENLVIQSVPSAFNHGLNFYQKGTALIEENSVDEGRKNLQRAIDSWNLILTAYEYDKNKEIDKMNLSKTTILQYLADAASKKGDNAQAKKYLEMIMGSEKPVAIAFTQLALMQLEEKDTVTALQTIERGRKVDADDKNLISLELMIYQNQGREDELTDKISKALDADPGNPNLLYNRATLYDKKGRNIVEKEKPLIEAIGELNTRLASSVKPDEQKKLKAEIAKKEAELKELEKKQWEVDSLAIIDYKKAFDANPDFFEAVYNLGAIYFNMTVPWLEKSNAVPFNLKGGEKLQQDYKKKYDELFALALEWFLQAEKLNPTDDGLLYNIQTTYAQLGQVEKSNEYKAKRESNQ